MPRAPSPSSRPGAGRSGCTRCDLVTLALVAMLCSATYCFSIWHNGRNAPEKIVIGKTPFAASPTLCGGVGGGGGDDDAYAYAEAAELDFQTHHTAEKAGLSVSTKAPAISGRRALRAASRGAVDTVVGAVLSGGSSSGGGKGSWARVVDDDESIRFKNAGAVRD